MFATANPCRLKNVLQSCHRKQRDFDILLRRVDVEIFDLRKSCAILRSEADDIGMFPISLLIYTHRGSADCGSSGHCDIGGS